MTDTSEIQRVLRLSLESEVHPSPDLVAMLRKRPETLDQATDAILGGKNAGRAGLLEGQYDLAKLTDLANRAADGDDPNPKPYVAATRYVAWASGLLHHHRCLAPFERGRVDEILLDLAENVSTPWREFFQNAVMSETD